MLIKTIVFTALVAFASTVITPAPAYANEHSRYLRKDHCQYHSHTGSGRSVSKKTARWAARQKWRYVVLRDNHNTPGREKYARWTYAVEKSSSCRRKWRVYKCKVKAFPCKSRVKVYRFSFKRITNNFMYHCQRRYGKFKIKTPARVGVKNGRKSADWVCVFYNGDRKPLSVLDACRRRYGKSNVVSARSKNSEPYSWRCRVRRLVNLG